MSAERFDELVSDALDQVPARLAAAMDNVVVLVADRNEDNPELLGLYHGVALTSRDNNYSGMLPDTITIYREGPAGHRKQRGRRRAGGAHHRRTRDRPPLRDRRGTAARARLGLSAHAGLDGNRREPIRIRTRPC